MGKEMDFEWHDIRTDGLPNTDVRCWYITRCAMIGNNRVTRLDMCCLVRDTWYSGKGVKLSDMGFEVTHWKNIYI